MASSLSLRFDSEHFDYQSELPADYNAGNRFYGKDVAEFLCEALRAAKQDASVYDEDWGWVVNYLTADRTIVEVAIYNLSEHREGGRSGAPAWGLGVSEFEKKKLLGLIPKTSPVAVSAAVRRALEEIFKTRAIVLEEWLEGPDAGE